MKKFVALGQLFFANRGKSGPLPAKIGLQYQLASSLTRLCLIVSKRLFGFATFVTTGPYRNKLSQSVAYHHRSQL